MISKDSISVLELLSKSNEIFSYDVICKMSDEQKQIYHDKLEIFLKYNEMKRTDSDAPENLNRLKGQSLEDLASYLIKVSGSLFTVERNLRTSTNEIDQVFKPTQMANILIANGIIDKHYELFLGECKNYNKSVDVTYVGKFCSLLLTNQIKLGILFSYHGITGSGWNNASGLVRKFYLHKEKEEDRFHIIDFSKDDFIAIKGRRQILYH